MDSSNPTWNEISQWRPGQGVCYFRWQYHEVSNQESWIKVPLRSSTKVKAIPDKQNYWTNRWLARRSNDRQLWQLLLFCSDQIPLNSPKISLPQTNPRAKVLWNIMQQQRDMVTPNHHWCYYSRRRIRNHQKEPFTRQQHLQACNGQGRRTYHPEDLNHLPRGKERLLVPCHLW